MRAPGTLVRAGERLTLACSCRAEIVVPVIAMLPRHHVARILLRGARCQGLDHSQGQRAVVRGVCKRGRDVFTDVRAVIL